jgi:hypothetical protein
MIWLTKRIWVLVVSVATLIGIFYIPADTIGIEEAARPWQRWLAMIDQNTALWIFAICCVCYMGWIEVRPFLAGMIKRKQVEETNYSEKIIETFGVDDAKRRIRFSERASQLRAAAQTASYMEMGELIGSDRTDSDILCLDPKIKEQWENFEMVPYKLSHLNQEFRELGPAKNVEERLERYFKSVNLRKAGDNSLNKLLKSLLLVENM